VLNPFRVQGRQRQAHWRSLQSPRFSSDSRVVSFLLVAAASEMGQGVDVRFKEAGLPPLCWTARPTSRPRVIKIRLRLWVLNRWLRRMRPALGESS
jgi:hypothetical protein